MRTQLLDIPGREDILRQLAVELQQLRQAAVGAAAGSGRPTAVPASARGAVLPADPGLAEPAVAAQLWSSKYQPARVEQLCGNAGPAQQLLKWLEDWRQLIQQEGAAAAAAPAGPQPGKANTGAGCVCGCSLCVLMAGPRGGQRIRHCSK